FLTCLVDPFALTHTPRNLIDVLIGFAKTSVQSFPKIMEVEGI
ncbi:4171_t:CDS:1, partial [Entrophospora sp. SA101]